MKVIRAWIRSIQYPKKVTKTLSFQILAIFFIIFSSFMAKSYIINNIEEKYSYYEGRVLQVNFNNRVTIQEVLAGAHLEQIAETRKLLQGVMQNACDEGAPEITLSYRTAPTADSKYSTGSIYFSNQIKYSYQFNNVAFYEILYRSGGEGVYVSEAFAMEHIGYIPTTEPATISFVTKVYKDDWGREVLETVEVPVAGVLRMKEKKGIGKSLVLNDDRIFADFSIFPKLSKLSENDPSLWSISAYYKFSSEINQNQIKKLQELTLNIVYREWYTHSDLELLSFTFSIGFLFLTISCIVILVSIALLYLEKVAIQKDTIFIQKIFYQNKWRILGNILWNNFLLILFSYLTGILFSIIGAFVIHLLANYIIDIPIGTTLIVLFILLATSVIMTGIGYFYQNKRTLKL